MKTLILIIIVNVILFNHFVFAQIKVTGIVKDETGSSMPGVNIIIKGTSLGTISDFDGKYAIEAPDSASILFFSFVGCKTLEKPIHGEVIDVVLLADATGLDEVVVIAMGVKREKKSLGYAISEVSGRAEGVTVRSSPGSASKIAIRGATSLATISPTYDAVKGAYESSPTSTRDDLKYSVGDKTLAQEMKSGLLTAGEINDFSKWDLWKDISAHELKQWQQKWNISPMERYSVQLQTEQGISVADAEVRLMDKENTILWQSKTDNTGKAELWMNLFGEDKKYHRKDLYIKILYNGKEYTINSPTTFKDGLNVLKIPTSCIEIQNIDIAFMIDATSSMGDEIEYLKSELNDIILKVKDSLPAKTINLGTVFYRDEGDEYITKNSDLSPDINKTIQFIKSNSASGGGDYEEAVDQALNEAINTLNWSETAISRILFMVLDAPPHYNSDIVLKIQCLALKASMKGIRIIPVTCSGIDKGTEYLMRSLALATNGTYVFLTNDSGIGGDHIKPTTDTFEVELLNKLLLRLILNYSNFPGCGKQIPLKLKNDTITIKNPTFVQLQDTTKKVGTNGQKDSLFVTLTNIPEPELISWKYYPNPTNGPITIEMVGKANELFVMDLNGKIIQRTKIHRQNTLSIDLSPYPTGIYFIAYSYATDKWLKGKVMVIH